MVPYKHVHKCLRHDCNNKVEVKNTYCDECKTTSARQLQRNNPNGYNAFKTNPRPKVDIVVKLTKDEQYDRIKGLGNEIWRKKREILSLSHEFAKLQREYFGWVRE